MRTVSLVLACLVALVGLLVSAPQAGAVEAVRVTLDWPAMTLIHPTTAWQTAAVKLGNPGDFRVDENFYVVPRRVP